jgi:hypothetical protein
MDERDVLHMARSIRPHLRELLGEKADEVDGELSRLLRRSDDGHAVEPDVMRVIGRHDETREWAERLLAVAHGDLAFAPMPGTVQYIPPSRWTCPRFAECGTEFLRYSSGEPVPPCPVHGVELVQEAG